MKIILTQKDKEQVDKLHLAELAIACLPAHLKAVLEVMRAQDEIGLPYKCSGLDEVTVEVAEHAAA